MHDYFGEDVAARYDDSTDEQFDPAVIDRTVGFLAELAGDGPALEFGSGPAASRSRWPRAASRCAASSSRRR